MIINKYDNEYKIVMIIRYNKHIIIIKTINNIVLHL